MQSPTSHPSGTPSAVLGPSYDEVVARLAPTARAIATSWETHRGESLGLGRAEAARREVAAWLERHRGEFSAPDRPSHLVALLGFGRSAVGYGAISDAGADWLDRALPAGREWAVTEWLVRAASRLPVPERVAAAVELASAWWLPALRAADPGNADAVELFLPALSAAARNPASPRAALESALTTRAGLPRSGPPPEYVGHYCAAVWALVEGVVNPPGHAALARCLGFATVAPDGSDRAEAIAAAVEGRPAAEPGAAADPRRAGR